MLITASLLVAEIFVAWCLGNNKLNIPRMQFPVKNEHFELASADCGGLYGPIILHILPMMHRTFMNTIQVTINLKSFCRVKWVKFTLQRH